MSTRTNTQVVKDTKSIALADGDSEEVSEDSAKISEQSRRLVTAFLAGYAVLSIFLILPLGINIIHLLLAVAFALHFKYIRKHLSSRERLYSDFGRTVDAVSRAIREEECPELGSLECPLLETMKLPPSSPLYLLTEKQFGISHKKSGKVLLEGQNVQGSLRLSFMPLEEQKGDGYSLSGSRSTNGKGSSTETYSIQRGFLSTKSLKAYWEETSKDGTRRVISAQFHQDYNSFEAEWLASDGNRGILSEVRRTSVDGVEEGVGEFNGGNTQASSDASDKISSSLDVV
jgi:hypothetical protein